MRCENPLLILCPLTREIAYLKQAFARHSLTFEELPHGLGQLSFCSPLNCHLGHGGHGKAQFGIQAVYYGGRIPSLGGIVCVGAAGALSADVLPFDIVIGDWTIEHDYKERFDPSAELPRFKGDARLADIFRSAGSDEIPIHFGGIASGDEDIVDVIRARELHRQTQALAVAWEGAGAARAAAFLGIPFVELRGVTDGADSHAPASFDENLGRSMSRVGELIFRALR